MSNQPFDIFLDYLLKNELETALHILEQAIASNPNDINNYWYLGIVYLLKGDIETAQATWMSVLWEKNDHDIEEKTKELITLLTKIGAQLQQNQLMQKAQLIYEQLISLDEENLNNYHILTKIYQYLGNLEEAELLFLEIIELSSNNYSIYLEYANFLVRQYRYQDTINLLKKAIIKFPLEQNLYWALVKVLKNNGQAKKAIIYAEKGLNFNPSNLIFQWENLQTLPILYKEKKDIEYYRQRFSYYLDKISNYISLETEVQKQKALQAISSQTNFYLQYQGKNDLSLQQKYGQLVEKIIQINYPDLKQKKLSHKQGNKIKIGLISGHFRDHNGANWSLGWLKHLNKDKFIINCYYLESKQDYLTEEFNEYSDNFLYLGNDDIITISQQVIKDEIEVLIYTDIGMKPMMTKLACLRLAPVQCVTLGHPITSGISTIDYYISRDLMEPQNAQEHYTEKLFLLPNIGLYLEPQKLPENPKQRSDYNLDNDSILYLCCQSLFKYLPQFDYIYPQIALEVANAKFVFIEFPISEYVNQLFQERLANAFGQYQLNYQDYCLILPRLNDEEFTSLMLIADIFLDTFTWSGDNTTRLAVNCDLPIVTCPGEFMRGRHSYGILKMIEVEETIASTEEEYIKISIELGKNSQWRTTVQEKIRKNKYKLFHDWECINSLETFLLNVVSY